MPTIPKLSDNKKPRKSSQYAKYYNSGAWYRLRNLYIREHPLCEICLEEDKTTPAEEIHHKIPFSTGCNNQERWKLLLDKNNLQALCKEHHKQLHAEQHK